jgi:hypothetical protein
MKTVTIPDPAEVSAWLDREQPADVRHYAIYSSAGWSVSHYPNGSIDDIRVTGATPEGLLVNIRAELAKRQEPIERLRREADALNLQLIPKP